MQRRILAIVLTFEIAAGTLILTGCATPDARISQHPEMYHTLSQTDQALVSKGQIRPGMTMDAVWLAWGSPDRKIIANMRGRATETWIYVYYATYPYYPYHGRYVSYDRS